MIPIVIRKYKWFISLAMLIVNILLLQSWVPIENFYFSYNGVSWFLSTLIFLNILNAPLQKIDKKIGECRNSKKIYLLIMIIYCIFPFILGLTVKVEIDYWLYIFPPARIFDYVAGFCLGKIFLLSKAKYSSFKNGTIKEILCVAIIILYLMAFPYIPAEYSRAAVFIPGALICINIIAYQNGYISRNILSNSVIVYLGNTTLFYMMSHQVIMRYLNKIVNIFDFQNKYMLVVWISLTLLITIGSAPFFELIKKRLQGLIVKNTIRS